MRVWYVLFAESPGFSPSREFSCFLPSPFVQLFCAQSGDLGGASASGQFSSDQEASKALDCTFLSFFQYTLRWPFLLFLLTYRGYGEKPFSSPSVCQIASRGELELKKNLVCDPNLRIVLVIVWDLFHCVKTGLFPDLIWRNARGLGEQSWLDSPIACFTWSWWRVLTQPECILTGGILLGKLLTLTFTQ